MVTRRAMFAVIVAAAIVGSGQAQSDSNRRWLQVQAGTISIDGLPTTPSSTPSTSIVTEPPVTTLPNVTIRPNATEPPSPPSTPTTTPPSTTPPPPTPTTSPVPTTEPVDTDSPSPIPSTAPVVTPVHRPVVTPPATARPTPSSPITNNDADSPSPVPSLPPTPFPSNNMDPNTAPQPARTSRPATKTPSPGSDDPTSGSTANDADNNDTSSDGSVSSGSNSGTIGDSSSSSSASAAGPTPPSSSGSDGKNDKTTPTATTVTTTKSTSPFHQGTMYLSVICAAVSVALLVAFHVVAFDTSAFDWPHDWLRANGWELLLYVGYLQQVTSLSHLNMFQTPSFMWQYSDAFSWCSFLIQRTKLTNTAFSRRLADQDVFGFDGFGSRIAINSSNLLVNAVVGVAVVFAFIVFMFGALAMCGRKVADDKFDIESSAVSSATQGLTIPTRRRGTLCVLGFGVIVWFIALYPLTALATYDIASHASTTPLAIVVLSLFCVIVLGGLAATIIPKSDERLMSTKTLKLFGALYADVSHQFRWFFVVTSLAQIALGVCIGAIRQEEYQLTVALIIVVGYLLTMLLCSPFTSQTPLYMVAAVCVLKIINYSIAFAFVSSKDVTSAGRDRAANAIISITSLVLLLWFIRLLAMLFILIRLVAERNSTRDPQTPAYYRRESVKDDGSENPYLAGSGVYVTMVTPDQSRLGSEFGESSVVRVANPQRRPARMAMAL